MLQLIKKKYNQEIGILGEQIAADYLSSFGLKILERNFKKRYAELDIVVLDGTTLVFVEVKTRKGTRFGLPEESITPWKLKSLIHSCHYYKLLHPGLPQSMRIDVVSIQLTIDNKVEKINWFKNITG